MVEAAYGSDWYTNERYSGPRSFDVPKDWLAYPGRYRSQDPWFNNFRVVLRKGKLWLVIPEGEETLLKPVDADSFQVGEEPTAERIRFDTVINGKAIRAELSGKFFYRSFTP